MRSHAFLFLVISILLLDQAAYSQLKPGIPKNIHGNRTFSNRTLQPAFPFPQNKKYALPGYIKPAGAANKHVEEFYSFWKKQYLTKTGPDQKLYRIRQGKDREEKDFLKTTSEGQGYGMIIVALMAGHDPEAQEIFDGLWRFSRQFPSAIERSRTKLMSWEIRCNASETSCTSKNEDGELQDSAFDGDSDIAYALLFANKQWGNSGPIKYRDEAVALIRDIFQRTIGTQSKLPLLGDWVDKTALPAGVVGNSDPYNQYTARTSDFMLSNFRAFQNADPASNWAGVIAAVQSTTTTVQRSLSPRTGLLPDFLEATNTGGRINFQPAAQCFLEKSTDGTYGYNACRVPFRLGLDALATGDPVSLQQAGRIAVWVETKGRAAGEFKPTLVKNGYDLEGNVIRMEDVKEPPEQEDGDPAPPKTCGPRSEDTTTESSAFLAPFAVSAMTQPSQQLWLNSLYTEIHRPNEAEDYFEHSLTLLSLLVLTENFWQP